jgi:hypothetical protein
MKKALFYAMVFAIMTWIVVTVIVMTREGITGNNTLASLSILISLSILYLETMPKYVRDSVRLYRKMKERFINQHGTSKEIPAELKSMPIMVYKENLWADYEDYLRVDLLFHYRAPEELIEKLKI